LGLKQRSYLISDQQLKAIVMNNMIRFLVFALLLASCKRHVDKNEEKPVDCIALAQNSQWTTSEFKADYTIQVPATYSTPLYVGYEGKVFFTKRNDNTAQIAFAYCSPLQCTDFGDKLASPAPASIDITINGSTIKLDQKANFCDGDNHVGILYYNHDNNSLARLYWKDKSEFKQALELSYDHSLYQEMIDIIKTIKLK
jgi:hypothetical protein